jgi:DNA-binding MarR family transcriptional regulator
VGEPAAGEAREAELTAPLELTAAPGYGARRMYQAYLAAWSRHVDSVITGPQFAVLSTVKHYPGTDQSSLAAVVALDTSTMADLCRRLEQRGLIKRSESPSDARRKLLSLTEEGAAALDRTHRSARRLDKALLGHLSAEERRYVVGLLNELGETWEKVAGTAGLGTPNR